MPEREILIYPKYKIELRSKSESIQDFDRKFKRVVEDLKDTLLAHPEGIGLAAPQIGLNLRTVVVRLGGKYDWDSKAGPPIVLANPEIVAQGDEQRDFDGCLSFPGLYSETVRPHYLRVIGLTEDGHPFDQIYQGFDAVLVHHEIDHLDGVLFIDRTQTLDDLYRVYMDRNGKPERVPLSKILQKREEPIGFIE